MGIGDLLGLGISSMRNKHCWVPAEVHLTGGEPIIKLARSQLVCSPRKNYNYSFCYSLHYQSMLISLPYTNYILKIGFLLFKLNIILI